MPKLRVLTAAEQVADHLRRELVCGVWGGRMPGGDRLAEELGVGRNTVEEALRLLEAEGLLLSQGPGRRRSIILPDLPPRSALRVAILTCETVDQKLDYQVEIKHELLEAGHEVFYTPRCVSELGTDLGRIVRMAEGIEADAWVVMAGSREMLEWFAEREFPVFALFGRRRGLPIAGVGPDKPSAYALATRTLLELGHRRIVLMARKLRRLPEPGASEQAFLRELASHGIPPGPFHLPDWEESIEGFHARLDSLFELTPPTALILDESPFLVAALEYLANRGLRVPQDVSLICSDADAVFDWCRLGISHIRWDSRPVVRRIVRWAANVGCGRKDLRQTLTPAEFVRGGTIGRARVG